MIINKNINVTYIVFDAYYSPRMIYRLAEFYYQRLSEYNINYINDKIKRICNYEIR